MILHRIRLYSYHSFLVIPFIVLFLYAHNMDQTDPGMTIRPLIVGFGLSLLVFGVFYLFVRNRLKTGVLVTLVLLALFQYGVLYEVFESLYYKGLWPLQNIHRYLLLVYMVGIVAAFVFIKRSKRDFIRINYFLNLLIFLLIVFNLVKIVTHQYSGGPRRTELAKPPPVAFNGQKNDIYYIILDGYGSNRVLRQHFNFENDEFTATLKKLNFNISDSAYANYYFTSYSLSSAMNMRYLSNYDLIYDQLPDNELFRTMKFNGYSIYHLYSGYAVTSYFKNADSTVFIDGPNEFEKGILRHTILRLDDLVGVFAHQRLKSQFRKMMDMAVLKRSPKLCFMHFVAPHPPYIFHRDGRIRTKHRFAEHSWEPKEYYIDQLVYVNKQISTLLYKIAANNPQATIILQSDHGPWITSNDADKVFDARAHTFYAWRSPSNLHIPRTTSNVNTFRYVLNGLYNCRFDILRDTALRKERLYTDVVFLKKIK